MIKNQIPNSQTEKVLPSNENIVNDKAKEFDQLFAINNTFAKMRHDMNRLVRKTWSMTNSIHGLENHIWLILLGLINTKLND